jgi:arginine-tRNA-protein transferase
MQEPIRRQLAFYASVPTPCSYLPGRTAVTVFVDPLARMNVARYGWLVERGFRRSGEHVYMPYCPGCDACVPARIPVADFKPNRSQRRIFRRNSDLSVRRVPTAFVDEHYRLYQRYVSARHAGSSMENYGPEHYTSFLACDWGESYLYEFRDASRLVAVASVDHLESGLSAVYTFFDPELSQRGLGVYAVLWQVETARRMGLPFVYLGYWIAACENMRYKANFQPLQIYRGDHWELLANSFSSG